jgi:signal transduction histidine kinase
MLFRFILVQILLFFSYTMTFSQESDLKTYLGKMYTQTDSSDYFLDVAKSRLKSQADSGIYFYFLAESKNLRFQNQEAIKAFTYALDYIDPIQNPELASLAYIRLTRISKTLGQFEKALDFSQKGIQHARSSLDSNYLGYHHLDIAVIYHDMEDYAQGVYYGKEAMKILNSYSKVIPTYQAFALNSIAINFDDWNKPDSALFYHFQVLEDIQNLDSLRIVFTFNNIGNTLLKQKKFREAKKWVEIALGLNRKDGTFYGLATNFTNLATIAYHLGDFQESRQWLDSASKYVRLSESIEKQRDYLYEEFQYFKRLGDSSKAISFLEEYSSLKDSIFKVERVKLMGELETLYEVETKELELAQSRAALAENELIVKNRNNQLLLLLLALLIILGSSFFIYYRQKNKNLQLEQEAKLQAIYAEQETQKKLAEQRNRISSDLHDNIGAQLTFIVSSLNQLKFGNLTKEQLGEKIDRISSFTVDTVNELRDTIWAMNKDAISVEDLQLRLAGLIQKAQESCPQIQFELKIDEGVTPQLQLNSLEGVNLYRIAQEALNNAIKHAEAGKIEIFITQENEADICLSVMDNGKGFDEKNPDGNGMNTMRTRAERIGKELKIESQAGSGTFISVC